MQAQLLKYYAGTSGHVSDPEFKDITQVIEQLTRTNLIEVVREEEIQGMVETTYQVQGVDETYNCKLYFQTQTPEDIGIDRDFAYGFVLA